MGVNESIQAERRPQIIKAAIRVIAAKGFQNTTLNAVAQEAGLSKGGIVHYFPTKESIILTTFVEFFDGIFLRGIEVRDKFTQPLERILSFTWMLEKKDIDYFPGCRLTFDFMSIASQKEEYRKYYSDWVNRWLFFLVEVSKREFNRAFLKRLI